MNKLSSLLRPSDAEPGARLAHGMALPLCLFCAVLLCVFSPCLLQRKVLAPLDIVQNMYEPWAPPGRDGHSIAVQNHFVSDGVTQYLGYRYIASESLRQDGYVGWSPLTLAGVPQYANTMGLYFDWTVQLHRVLGFWEAWHIGLMAQFAIAGIGMLLFLRAQSISPATCLAGAIIYAGNSQFVLWIYHRWALGSFCWVPWLLWALERSRGGPAARVIPLSVVTALAFLGGNLQNAAFILLVILSVVLSWLWGDGRSGRARLKEIAPVLASTGLALALAAVMFVPCAQAFFDNTAADHHRGSLGYRGGWREVLLQPVVMLFWAFPSALGSPSSLDLAKVFKQDYFDLVYFGFLPVVIAFYCIFRRRTPKAARFLMLAGLLVPLTPLNALLYRRVFLLFIAGGVWAFADYWDKVDRESAGAFGRKALLAFGALSIAWVLGSILVAANRQAIVALVQGQVAGSLASAQFGVFREWMLGRAGRWVSEVPIWSGKQALPWVLAGVSMMLLRWRRDLRSQYVTYALSAVLAAEVCTFAYGWITLSPRPQAGVLPENPEIEQLKQVVGSERAFLVKKEGRPPLVPANTLATFGISTLQGYESIIPKTMWHKAGYAVTSDVLSRMAVRFAIVQRDPVGEAACWQPQVSAGIRLSGAASDFRAVDERIKGALGPTSGGGAECAPSRAVRSTSCWPLVYRGRSFDVFENGQALPRYQALGFGYEALGPEGFGRMEAGTVAVISETFNHRNLRVPPGAEVLRVAENWSPGWRYRLENREWHRAIQSGDMSLWLPLARSDRSQIVELEFRPADWGRWVSLCSWLAVILVSSGGVFIRIARSRRASHAIR